MVYALHRGDVLTVPKTLPDESVHAVVTDTPYNAGGRTSSDHTSRTGRARYVTTGSAHDLSNFPGEKRDQCSYGAWLTALLTEAHRPAVEHCVARVFCDRRQSPTTGDALQMAGWTWSGTLPRTEPTSRLGKGGFTQCAEFITWGLKGSLDKDHVHNTQKPIETMCQLVRICQPDKAVPASFVGSGPTGVAALREGRHLIGVELFPQDARVAVGRPRAELTRDDFVLAGPER